MDFFKSIFCPAPADAGEIPIEPDKSEYLGLSRPTTPSYFLPDEAPKDENLCALCRQLDFRTILHHGISYDFIPLGSFVDLQKKKTNCAFCRLATAAIVQGWQSFVPDWESCTGVELAQCELACTQVSLCPTGQARYLHIRVYPLPAEIAESKVRSGRVDMNAIHVLADDAHLFGLAPEYHNRLVAKTQLEVARMKEWLSICEEFHAEECAKEIEENIRNVPSALRVIDVVENRLVPMRSDPSQPPLRYVALSYVWGAVSTVGQYQTDKANFQRRTKKGGLDGVVFPKTILDAITLVRLLGERYLWVDAVCIIQDDSKDKAAQIHSMNIIYGASYLTIIGAGGDNADVGLPRAHGDTPSRDVVQMMDTVQGVRMMLPLKRLQDALPTTYWFTRGWTYQERLLPCRRLYFTPEQVYFECRRCSWSEDVLAEDRTIERNSVQACASGGNQLRKSPARSGWDDATLFLQAYTRTVEEYTKRNVSFDSDALNAFMGVANVLAESYGGQITLFYGLPAAQLEGGLLWQPKFDHVRRESGKNGVYLPSWSWAGWRGPVTYTNRNPWMSISSSHLIVESVVPEWILHTSETQSKRLDVESAKWWRGNAGEKSVSRPPPIPSPLPEDTRPVALHGGILEFLTTSAFFKVRTGSEHGQPCYCYDEGRPPHEHADRIHLIVDAQGHTAGNLFLDCKTLEEIDIYNTPGEFIILSRSGSGDTTCPGYNEQVYTKAQYCLFDAMLIEWKEGIAYRLGLGKIHEDAWVQADPKWKRIFMS
jgi:hypothetical protein